jgi:hypothetical protein
MRISHDNLGALNARMTQQALDLIVEHVTAEVSLTRTQLNSPTGETEKPCLGQPKMKFWKRLGHGKER